MAPRNQKGILSRILELNWILIGLVTLVVCIGFVILYSAAEGHLEPWALKQIVRFIVLFPVMLVVAMVDIRLWLRYAYVVYGIALILLVLIDLNIFSVTAMGATRWIRIGPLNIQPSEIIKISLVFALARYFHYANMANITRIVYLIIPVLMVLLPVVLVMKQPDLGTSIIILMVGGAMFFVAGVRLWKFLVVLIGGSALMPLAWHFMHDYQKKRIITFIDPERDPLGAGYNILQSKIAVGSGGFWGKGWLEGTQSQLSFLPEKQTDFIFTMFSEEFGFLGDMVLILLYATIITYGIIIAVRCSSHFGRMMAMGIVSTFFLHVFVNIAMVIGLLPIVGVPLPLVSYGGTMLITMLISFGLLLNADLHRDETLPQDSSVIRRS
jgi:rod shape determining protein RodA